MRHHPELLVAVFLFLAGCTDLGDTPSIIYYEEDIQEALFRYQFSNNYSGQQQSAGVYFIELFVPGDSMQAPRHLDPSDQFMQRFRGHVPPVKKLSQCTYDAGGVFDKETGARGLIFRVGPIREIKEDEVEVDGGYFEGGLSASGNIYTLQRRDGHWVVVKDILVWIS